MVQRYSFLRAGLEGQRAHQHSGLAIPQPQSCVNLVTPDYRPFQTFSCGMVGRGGTLSMGVRHTRWHIVRASTHTKHGETLIRRCVIILPAAAVWVRAWIAIVTPAAPGPQRHSSSCEVEPFRWYSSLVDLLYTGIER